MVNSNGITFSGLASGLDTGAIIQQLVALERIPIQVLEAKKDSEQSKLDKIDALAELVKTLQTKAEKLSTSGDFLSYAVSNPDPSIATITATSSAAPGAHTLEVARLAATDRWAFDGVVDPTEDLATKNNRKVEFSVGGTFHQLTFGKDDSSLNEIAAAIEDAAGDDVLVEIVNTGPENDPSYRLVLTSKTTGAEGRITQIRSTVQKLDIDGSPPDSDGDPTSDNNLTVGNNALATIDGLEFERESNDFSDVVDGLEITLLSTNEGSPLTFSVTSDKEVMRASIDELVTAYNDVIRFINEQSTYTPPEDEDEGPGTSGVLFGDSILQSVQSNIRRALFDVDLADVIDDTEGYSTLSLVGITSNSDGTLKVDSDLLDQKMADNLQLFVDLFTDDDGFDNGGAPPNTHEYYEDQTADSGLMASLVREIDRMFGTFDGPIDSGTGERITLDALFDLKEDTIRANIRRFEDQVESMERRLGMFEQNLVQRFARLEELMGALNAQGAALANALASNNF